MTAHPPTWARWRRIWCEAWRALSCSVCGMFARVGRPLLSALRWTRAPHALPAAPASAVPVTWRARSAPTDIERVVLEPDADTSLVFRRLQGPGSKIFDLRQVEVSVAFFDELAAAWHAAPGMVPRLAIVLDYERWVVFHHVARVRMIALKEREVEVEIVYDQLLDLGRLSAWFARGRLLHAMPAVVAWLRTEWRPTAFWPWVLDVTARLIEASASVEEVPQLLLEISDLARSCGEVEGANEAANHAHTALQWIGDTPSTVRCRALRAIAATALIRGDADAAVARLDEAMMIARVVEDEGEGAWALVDLGMLARGCRRFAAAEAAFRRAALLAPAHATSLRAVIHQQLARVLAQQAKHDEAERHAHLAATLRSTPAPWAIPVSEGALQNQSSSRRAAAPSTRES